MLLNASAATAFVPGWQLAPVGWSLSVVAPRAANASRPDPESSLICAPFGKAQRLNNAAEFSAVFDQADFRIPGKSILCLARYNGYERARLGVVVNKKVCRLASRRNGLKRQVRESFRVNQYRLTGLDIVILARSGMGALSNTTLRQQLEKVWNGLRSPQR